MSAFYQKGLYVGECVGQWMGQSEGGKKTPYFALKFNILARVEGEREVAVEQSERSVYLYLSDAALDMTTDVLTHLGYDKDSLRFLDPARDGFFNFAGKRCDLWCKIEEYQGDTKEKWQVSMPLNRDITPIDDKELRRLDTLFGKAVKAKKPAATPAPPAEPKGELVGVSDVQRNAAPKSSPDKPPTEADIPF